MTYVYEFLYRGRVNGDSAWHVVLADEVETLGKKTHVESGPLTPGQAEELGFPLDKIIKDLNAATLIERDTAVEEKVAVVKEKDEALKNKAEVIIERDAARERINKLIVERDKINQQYVEYKKMIFDLEEKLKAVKPPVIEDTQLPLKLIENKTEDVVPIKGKI